VSVVTVTASAFKVSDSPLRVVRAVSLSILPTLTVLAAAVPDLEDEDELLCAEVCKVSSIGGKMYVVANQNAFQMCNPSTMHTNAAKVMPARWHLQALRYCAPIAYSPQCLMILIDQLHHCTMC
jgi:hypothetical protein